MCVYAPLPSSNNDEAQRQNLKPCNTRDYVDMKASHHQTNSTDLPRESERCRVLAHQNTSLKGDLRRTGESLYRRYTETTDDTHILLKRGKRLYYRRRLSAILEEPCAQEEKRK
ncbi:hypothetical protein TgHK011_002969 [Trichoderma gracile]|nr:hypothetical protein TgHK011_002969 [Trichoderma gracile]